jgi:hypothetical protein
MEKTQFHDEQGAFRRWAIKQGGMSIIPVHPGGKTKNGLHSASYWDDVTEIAWRAWTSRAEGDAK